MNFFLLLFGRCLFGCLWTDRCSLSVFLSFFLPSYLSSLSQTNRQEANLQDALQERLAILAPETQGIWLIRACPSDPVRFPVAQLTRQIWGPQAETTCNKVETPFLPLKALSGKSGLHVQDVEKT